MVKLNASEIADILNDVGEYHSMRDEFEGVGELVEFMGKCLKHIITMANSVQKSTNKKIKEILKYIKDIVRKTDYCVHLMSIKYNDKVREVEGKERTFAVLKAVSYTHLTLPTPP